MDHTFAEAEHQLSELIDRAIAGEGVVITRNGKPVAALRVVPDPLSEGRPMTKESIAWLAEGRPTLRPATLDTVALIRAMREDTDV